ncbi:30S ribosomal protein S15 [Candidatus Woesearchaeota archaeon]|mgnify:FL=1|jgi:small subunit ribosomal protein S15|nr:30S ribosomal protein S15 [Candidatus Woesearchaeota archaeon]MDP6648125.1 30S ribosomal protein S15 [Candidatus Woesearchaeota archaeon]|tara:strand:+ start:80494 stop:80949 length:456 start_codon:yes stop_codon:yes gene_type:complete
MARMHSRKRGKHGSKKPAKKTAPSWIRYKAKEVELLIAKLSKDGKSTSQIGILLRDTYGIPNVHALCGKSVSAILKEKKIVPEVPENLTAMFRRFAAIKKHLETNKHDETAARGLHLAESKINRLVKYYKRTGRLEETWKFDPDRMGFFAE